MEYIFALVGNPNSGKSTVFNELTGSRQYVGNWPGVTVEKKEGTIKNTKITIIDLPGTYSLRPSSPEQKIARDYIKSGVPNAVINVVDATNLERNLFLTTQLLDLDIPVVVALNMMDVVLRSGEEIDVAKLERRLGIPFIPISASKGDNLDNLIEAAVQAVLVGNKPTSCSNCKKPCHTSAQRYNLANEAARDAYKKKDTGKPTISDNVDKVLLHKFLAIPIFLMVMYSVFAITFGQWSLFLSDSVRNFFDIHITNAFNFILTYLNAPSWLVHLVSDGIIAGIGGILAFLPQIVILFFLLAILEDSGYMVRAAFILDKAMRPFGLGGKAFIPMVIGFGCSVPAIMATRTLDSQRERKLTILIAPFMSCSARLPIYVLFAGTFFPSHQQIIIFGMYILGVVIAVVSGWILSRTIVKGEATGFLLEIPPYRMPTVKNTLLHVWDRVWDFVERAGTIILIASVVVWFCQAFTFALNPATQEDSIISIVGRFIAPIFAPLGFGDWRASVAVLTGIAGKEIVVATLSIIGGSLDTIFNTASAMAFMVFTLLYIPCVAAIAAVRNELKSTGWAIFASAYQMVVAWVVAFIIYNLMRVVGL